MDLKVVYQKNEANEKNAPGPFIHCRGKTPGTHRLMFSNLYLYNTNSVCVCVCLSSIGGQTAGPIMTKFGTYVHADRPGNGSYQKKWSHVWSGRVGSLGPFFGAGT